MKANEFVKNCGIDSAKSLLKMGSGYCDIMGYGFHTDDLKRLIKSHELVCDCGGLEDAKSHLDSIRFNITTKTWFGQALLNWSVYADKLEKAILDVESCQ